MMKKVSRKYFKFLSFVMVLVLSVGFFGKVSEAKAASEPYLSGTMIENSYQMGETFSLSGKVKGDGGYIEKIHIHYYNEKNSNDCGVLGTVYPDKKNYSLSKLGEFTVGEDCFKKANATYIVKAWAKNEGGASVLLDSVRVKITEASEPYLSGTMLSETYTIGDTFTLGGKVCGDGEYLEKVYVHYYNINNTNDNGVLGTSYPGKKTYSLSKFGSFTVGTDCFKKANATYLVRIYAKNEGGKSVLLDSQYVTVKKAAGSNSGAFDYTYLTCNSYVRNYDKRNYINWAMQQYIEKQTALQDTLNNGKYLLFFFEGGTDASVGYDSEKDTNRNNAIVLAVRLENGYPKVFFASDKCTTLPDHPTGYGSYKDYYGPATVTDGIYLTKTVNHTGYGALNIVMPNNKSALYLEPNGNYRLMGASEINIHARWSTEPVKVVKHENVNSVGCLNIGENYYDGVYSSFMQKITGHKIEVRPNKIALQYTGNEIGYTIVDRQLFKNELYTLYNYNWDAVNALTAESYNLLRN